MITGLALLTLSFITTPLETSLDRVPERKAEWRRSLAEAPEEERAAFEYLLTYMPLSDLRALPVLQVAEAVHLATVARQATAWAPEMPDDVFLDAVVPYAVATEPRQSMRAEFQRRYLSLIKDTKTPGEAALVVNARLFKDYKVSYNTRRLRTDQSAPESIAQGMATCTGLSIMLVDALRAVGVPSRIAGIHSWPGRGGNHTWVEVWTEGRWHFVGAAEPDPQGLDHAWFADEAGGAIEDKPNNAIYAVTFRPTGDKFPLSWDPDATLPAENVTARYHKEKSAAAAPRLMVEVKRRGERVEAKVEAFRVSDGDVCLQGQSLNGEKDINLHLSTPATEGERYLIRAEYEGKVVNALATVKGDTVVRIDLDRATFDAASLLAERFGPDPAKAKAAAKLLESVPFTAENAAAAWRAYLDAPDPALRADFDANVVKTADRTSPYLWRTVGEKPRDGWGLVIAMHGGGGAPKEVNDGEWHGMFERYYRDHPEAGGYVYLALRAPNDEWNGFYDDAISPMVERLIRGFVKYGGVDPNRVYACGASHGGYGAFVIAPKIPYRFAAVHPAASAPTDGETAGENLRNLRFTWAVGERDTDYGRVERCRDFAKLWEGWRTKYGGFDGGLELVEGKGHLIGEHERDQVAELRRYVRTASPKRLVWTQTDDVLHRFYWLEALKPVDKGHIEAEVRGNEITLTTKSQGEIALWLTSDLVDLTKPVLVVRDGKRTEHKPRPSLAAYAEGLAQTADPNLTAPVRMVIP